MRQDQQCTCPPRTLVAGARSVVVRHDLTLTASGAGMDTGKSFAMIMDPNNRLNVALLAQRSEQLAEKDFCAASKTSGILRGRAVRQWAAIERHQFSDLLYSRHAGDPVGLAFAKLRLRVKAGRR